MGQTHQNNFDHPLHEYEDFLFDKLKKKIRNNPNDARFSTIEQAYDNIHDFR